MWEIIDEKGRTGAHIGWADGYQIKVPGELDARWSDWAAGMTLAVESGGDGLPVTTLTGTVDQAALQSVLRRLYSLGLQLISVIELSVVKIDDKLGSWPRKMIHS